MEGYVLDYKYLKISKDETDKAIEKLIKDRHINLTGFCFRTFIDVKNTMPIYLALSTVYYYSGTDEVRFIVPHHEFYNTELQFSLNQFKENLFSIQD